ncbi:MAG: hypothetical protein JW864_08355, partial [Spirochaetes bacterium]|nr:hypothetical protein [Spirochaetota bacterium]
KKKFSPPPPPRNNRYKTKAVASVPSSVENITLKHPQISIELIVEKIIESAKKQIPGSWKPLNPPLLSDIHYTSIIEKHISREWIYSHTPPFDISFMEKTDNDSIPVTIFVTKGRISDVKSTRQSLKIMLEPILKGCVFNQEIIFQKLTENLHDFARKDDLIEMFHNGI